MMHLLTQVNINFTKANKIMKAKILKILITTIVVIGFMVLVNTLSQKQHSEWISPDESYTVVSDTSYDGNLIMCKITMSAKNNSRWSSSKQFMNFVETKQNNVVSRTKYMDGNELLGADANRSIRVVRDKTYTISWYDRHRDGWPDWMLDYIEDGDRVTFMVDTQTPISEGYTHIDADLDKTYMNEALKQFSQCRANLEKQTQTNTKSATDNKDFDWQSTIGEIAIQYLDSSAYLGKPKGTYASCRVTVGEAKTHGLELQYDENANGIRTKLITSYSPRYPAFKQEFTFDDDLKTTTKTIPTLTDLLNHKSIQMFSSERYGINTIHTNVDLKDIKEAYKQQQACMQLIN